MDRFQFVRVMSLLAIFAAARPAAAQLTISTSSIAATAPVSVPLTNGHGVVELDVPVTVHAEGTALYVTRWEESPLKIPVATNASGMTLAGRGLLVLIVYVDLAGNAIRAVESVDGGRTWAASVRLADRPRGPALPSACVYEAGGRVRRAVVWSAQPSESDGPLVVALHTGTSWLTPVEHPSLRTSGAALHCEDGAAPEVAWRDHRDGTGTRVAIYQAQIDESGGLPGEHRVLTTAFDPSYCGDGGAVRYIGYHGGVNAAHIARSIDRGVTFAELDLDVGTPGLQTLDDDGKFVALDCAGSRVVAAWGDWPTKEEAAARADTRKLGLVVSLDYGATWTALRPANEDLGQGPATVAVSGQRALVMWRSASAVHLAVVTLP